jgi:hypothetical protein
VKRWPSFLAAVALASLPAALLAGVPESPKIADAEVRAGAIPPDSAQLRYTVSGNVSGIPYSAKSRLDWNNLGNRYSARLEVSVFLLGSRVQTSSGTLGPQGLVPARFSDKRRKEKTTDFDVSQGRIRFSSGANQVELLPGAQDRLSVFMQLAALFKARPAGFPRGEEIAVQVAGTGGAEVWRFQVGEESLLELPAGAVRARQLSRAPRAGHEGDSRVELWLAPELGYLPARIRISEPDGDTVDQRLSHKP